jgi:hypothetical protein
MKKKKNQSYTQFFRCFVGISDNAIPDNSLIGQDSNSYAIPCFYVFYGCLLAGDRHRFELPEGAILPEMKQNGNAFGCGLVLDTEDKLCIFFTLNGKLMGELVKQF